MTITRVLKQRKLIWEWEATTVTGGAPLLWTGENGDKYYGPNHLFRLATIGVGSSIAYYLNAMWQVSTRFRYDHKRTVMFGRFDGWDARVRGDGFINHEWHNIGHWSALKIHGFSEKYAERADFAKENAFHFWRVAKDGGTHVAQDVVSIARLGDVYEISTAYEQYLAAKVVCGAGAGPHYAFGGPRGPILDPTCLQSEEQSQYLLLNSCVKTLDEFMRDFPRPLSIPKKREGVVIVHGTNAGIDAVERAHQCGFAKILFFGSTESAAWLRGNRLVVSPNNRDEVKVTAIGRTRPHLKHEGGKITVKYTPDKGSPTAEKADFYVIALGQNADAKGAVGDVLRTGKITAEQLEPIYDTNQIFGLPFQTVLGLQVKGTTWDSGLQIVGAAAEALGSSESWPIAHNYTAQYEIDTDRMTSEEVKLHVEKVNKAKDRQGKYERFKLTVKGVEEAASMRRYRFQKAESYLKEMKMIDLMAHQIDPTKVPKEWMKRFEASTPYLSTSSNPAATAISSVLGAAQLGGVRATMAAMHSMIPDHILGNKSAANFTTDDRTMLAVYIAVNFPNIDETRANSLVEEIIRARRTSLGKSAVFTTGTVTAHDLGFTTEQTKRLNELLSDTDQIWKRIKG